MTSDSNDDEDIITTSSITENANLIADITGSEGITLDELDKLNPSQTRTEIQSRLTDLKDAAVVTAVDGQYHVTAQARDAFNEYGLFPTNAWRRQLQRVKRGEDDD